MTMGDLKIEANRVGTHTGGGIRGTTNRIIGLDLLRIALAILIYLFHSWMHLGCNYSILTDFASSGTIAMTGFFLLSGYSLRLVYGNQDLVQKSSLLKFYIRRILSVLPLYYFVSVIWIIFLGKESILDNILLFPIEALCMQSTFSSLWGVSHNEGTWFVSCIMISYLIYPFIQQVSKQLSNKHKVLILLSLVIVEVWAIGISKRFHTLGLYTNPYYRTIEFICGMLVADINFEEKEWLSFFRSKWLLLTTILVLIVSISYVQHIWQIRDVMIMNVIVLPCFIIMLFSLGSNNFITFKRPQIVGYMGKLTYPFFLTQFFAWDVAKWFIEMTGYSYNWCRILFSFTYCCIVSILMYECIQRPIVYHIKRKF